MRLVSRAESLMARMIRPMLYKSVKENACKFEMPSLKKRRQ